MATIPHGTSTVPKRSQPILDCLLIQAHVPLQVEFAVAQIDMVYSQYALLRLVAFVNVSYPPPNLDPLMVRTSVTLNEIVRERLVGPRRPHQLQKHQLSQPRVQVPPPSGPPWAPPPLL